MDIEKEANKLLEVSYCSDNEKDVIRNFVRTVSKDNNPNSIKNAYIGYSQFRRNSPTYNKNSSNLIDKIYKEKLNITGL